MSITPQSRRTDAETQKQVGTRPRREDGEHAELTQEVIGCSIEVHRAIGPGFPERIYARALQCELSERNIPFTTEHPVRVTYKNQLLGSHRLDLVVADIVVVELKAVYLINNFHVAQMLSYLKASGKHVGLILNFSRSTLEIRRVVW